MKPDPSPDSAPPDLTEHWRDLTGLVGREVAEPLSAALERVVQLATTGKIDRDSLRALRTEIESARRIGIVSQQLARFGAKRLRQSDERLDLAQTLQAVLTQRTREAASRGIEVRQSTRAIEVLADPALLFTLLNGLVDWAVELGGRRIAFRVDRHERPRQGRIHCTVSEVPAERMAFGTVTWYFVAQIADALRLPLETGSETGQTSITLRFPRTIDPDAPAVSTVELDRGHASSINSKPLAGSQVLVVSARRDLRSQVREALTDMGLVIDFVGSVDEAINFCADSLPHALVFDGVLSGKRIARLAEEIRNEVTDFALIEIVEEGEVFEVSGFSGLEHARVGREALHHALPSTLVFELSKQL
jgi:CheY-like chemotaxis protein